MATAKSDTNMYTDQAMPGKDVVPRPSASLVLLDAQNRILLTHRTSTLNAFANAHVFPGGAQDEDDNGSPEFCAVRETFEEAGVLLTTTAPSAEVVATLADVRRRIHARGLKFREWLEANGLEADVGGLQPFTTWITPPTMKKRFETRMFLSFLPLVYGGGRASGIRAGLEAGEIILFPPQAYLVTRLLAFTGDRTASAREQRERIRAWIEGEGMGKLVFEPRLEGKTKDGRRSIMGHGPRGDAARKTVMRFGKGGIPEHLEIVMAAAAAGGGGQAVAAAGDGAVDSTEHVEGIRSASRRAVCLFTAVFGT
ncbi:hypothetical protein DRE_01485 [Drechslerella stenobrocha 248]|uniref:Nudix hydrolase domain-containing protein n=1 Tax=Drechslerella stenobrocha 248 TaxID=1043628 RepID=W7HUT3_9PEZI|nr:hypothetical protein DRE_01485 [Drechslerella stenobrocha 248]